MASMKLVNIPHISNKVSVQNKNPQLCIGLNIKWKNI